MKKRRSLEGKDASRTFSEAGPANTFSPRASLALLACVLAAFVGMYRDIGSPARPGAASTCPRPDAQGNLPYAAPQPAAAALPARAWRLTHVEYRKSVRP